MAEKRKPVFIFLLKKSGKKSNKVEPFKQSDFQKGSFNTDRYRLRVNGKWFSKPDIKYWFLTKWEIRDILWRSINFESN